jgi:glycosyltransferase involved in cell wall biosynthesis
VIVPCRNEARFIERCLVSIASSATAPGDLEILVVDGMSDDGTRELIARAAAGDGRISLLDNPARTSPAALNLAIARARGSIIMRMDAHCEYPPDYIPALTSALESSGAANVGGITEVVPAAETDMARAIALALAHPAGVGNSYFRIGAKEPMWVDTVPFGCWRRETFDRVGLFDDSLPRNQDDEFNMRLARAGGRILLLPTVVTRYYARETLGQLWRMFYQYGFYKPLAALRSGAALRARQFAPAALVIALVMALLLAPLTTVPLALIAITYGLFLAVAAVPVALRQGPGVALALMAALPAMHFAYGLGFLRGAWQFAILKRAPAIASPRLSR